MKFFTKELWRGAQTLEDGENSRQWNRACEEYRAQLVALRSRLSEDAYAFFTDADVHDGELLKLVLEDGSRPAPLSEPSREWASENKHPVQTQLVVLDAYDKFIWTISYRALRRVVIDYPSENPLFYSTGEGFGDWGYDELTDAGDGFLRHEVLFATGASLLFECKHISVAREARRAGSLPHC